MEHNETNTLESIIRAAKEMARQRTKERALKPDTISAIEPNQKADFPTDSKSDLEVNLKANLETGLETDLETDLGIDLDTDLDTDLETDLETDLDTDLEISLDTNLDLEASKTDVPLSSESSKLQYIHENFAESKSVYIDPDPDEEALDFSDSTALLSAAQTFSDTLQTTGVHFLEFSVAFLSMTRRHYQQDINGELRANSLAFHALLALDSWADEHYTMSDLAEKLQIPKQQLTKLINDLESKELVTRIHDTENRRRVYIRICEKGRSLMEELKQEMLQSTLHGLRSYTKDDLLELDQCICQLTELMEKFNTDPA